MTSTTLAAADPLRIADLVPLRRMLGTDSVVIRVNSDGSFAPFERMPAFFFERPIRDALASDGAVGFDEACAQSVALRQAIAFRPSSSSNDEVMINPILDDDSSTCRFLVCWVRRTDTLDPSTGGRGWGELVLSDVATRFRLHADGEQVVVEAAPWWALSGGEFFELWPHHVHVSAMGLGHAVMETLIIDAAGAAAKYGGGPAVRISVPSADILAGLVPVFHGALRASGLDAARLTVAIDVELAVDPDLLPIIVHLRTMGLQIDIVGLDALTATLHTVSDTSQHTLPTTPPTPVVVGPWTGTYAEASSQAA